MSCTKSGLPQSNAKQDAKPSLPIRASASLSNTSKSRPWGPIPPASDSLALYVRNAAAMSPSLVRDRAMPCVLSDRIRAVFPRRKKIATNVNR